MKKGRMPILACGPFLLALWLASCGDRTAPSAEDNRQLDNAASMLDEAPDVLANVDANGLADNESEALNRDESER